MHSLIITAFAFKELLEIRKWYNNINLNLGQLFHDDWQNTALIIQQHPYHYQQQQNKYRYKQLSKFPYVLVYEIDGTDVIVLRIVHTSRHPKNRRPKK
jgi:plasmid stabilization system protein ParE